MRSRRHDPLLDRINVTPFVDVMLVLLVVFMITAPLITEAVRVKLPRLAASAVEHRTPPLIISIDRRGRLFVGKKRVSPTQLGNTVRATLKKKPQSQVLLRADKSISYGHVTNVMSLLKTQGVRQISLVVLPPQS